MLDLSYGQLVHELQQLAKQYPLLASAWTTQQRFGLPSAGRCMDINGQSEPCRVWVLEITHRPSVSRHAQRPDVLISGALHGDERVGPLATLELARWLLHGYESNPWARRLVHSRHLLLVPAANAHGFANHRRDELRHDPNRDFPFQQEPRACMQTIAARSINELFLRGLIHMSITFHAGMEAVGYVWGDFDHRRDAAASSRSPDHVGIGALARAASAYAGRGPAGGRGKPYPSAPMNSIVYPVHGGMEDWAYAASWEPRHVQPCMPSTHGGYAKSRTASYGNATARAVVLLVETSDKKAPPPAELGEELARPHGSRGAGAVHSHGIFAAALRTLHGGGAVAVRGLSAVGGSGGTVDGELSGGVRGDGHVPRNVRFALAAIDLVQPHVELHVPTPAEVVSALTARGCLPLSWRIWGAVRADATSIVWRDLSSTTAGESASGSWRPLSSTLSGDAVWGSPSGPQLRAFGGPGVFGECIELPRQHDAVQGTRDGGAGAWPRTVLLAATTTVDQAWARRPDVPITPSVPAQSHFVNLRTNEQWQYVANGREVRGQITWFSEVGLEVECTAEGRIASGTKVKQRRLSNAGELLVRNARG